MEFESHVGRSHNPAAAFLLRYANAEPQQLVVLGHRYRLTPTQSRVAALLADRLTNAEIAHELNIKPSTARRHTEAVLLRLGVNSRFKVARLISELFDQDGV